MQLQSISLLYLINLCTALVICRFIIIFSCKAHNINNYALFCTLKLVSSTLFQIYAIGGNLTYTLVDFIITFVYCHNYLKNDKSTSIFLYLCPTVAFSIYNAIVTVIDGFIPNIQQINGFVLTTIFSILIVLFSGISLEFVLKKFKNQNEWGGKYSIVYILPLIFILYNLQIITNLAYGTVTLIDGRMQYATTFAQNLEIIFLLLVSLVISYFTFYVYEKISKQVKIEQKNSILQVYTDLQKQYIEEAKYKYNKTQSFRHDTSNHILILKGLLENRQLDKATQYLKRLENETSSLSFDISTGNSTIDILLKEKFGFCEEQGINIDFDVQIPSEITLDDFDLCVILFNALDNAIKGCINAENPYIDLVAKRNKSFFIIDIINTYKDYPKGSGIGVQTIQFIVEKYNGVLEMNIENDTFRLSIMFSIE